MGLLGSPSRARPLPQVLRRFQVLRGPCGSGRAREGPHSGPNDAASAGRPAAQRPQ